MVTILFLLMGIVVLDIILSQNRRHRRQYPPHNYRHDDPYTPPYHAPRYTHEPNNYGYNSPHHRYDSPDYSHYQRENSPVVATMIFMIALMGLLYFLAH